MEVEMIRNFVGTVLFYTVTLLVAGVVAVLVATPLILMEAMNGPVLLMGIYATAVIVVAQMLFPRDLQSRLGKLVLVIFVLPSTITLLVEVFRGGPLVAGTSAIVGILWALIIRGLLVFWSFDRGRRSQGTATQINEDD